MLLLKEYVECKDLIDILCINEFFEPNIIIKLGTQLEHDLYLCNHDIMIMNCCIPYKKYKSSEVMIP